MIEICTVGGYSEVGKNMTAVKYDDEVVLLDMGLQVDKYILAKDENDDDIIDAKELARAGALPEEKYISEWKNKVLAIIPTHAHLDHLGAIPFMASKYDAEILCTPYSASVLKKLAADRTMEFSNKVTVLVANSVYQLSKNIKIEFINATHSTPHTIMALVHTPEGGILYCNDFKLDDHPVLGDKPNYKRLKELGKKKLVRLLIMDSLYSNMERKTPSESIAREMLKDVMLDVSAKGQAVIVTTFSSHIARLKSIVDFGKKMKRKIVFLGRSLAKYTYAAEECGIIKFSDDVEICGWGSQMNKKLREIEKFGRDKYLIVATGHQGEEDAVLSKIVRGKLNFRLFPNDHIIFSCSVIPSPVNVTNRNALEDELNKLKLRVFRDVHQSGHASREDHRDLIEMVKPEHIIPSHGDFSKTAPLISLAEELGYKEGTTVHLMKDGERLSI